MFGKKKNAVKSANLSVAIDNLTSQFTNMITALRSTSEEAIAAKETKEREIAEMQAECDNLKTVSDRALMLSDKIANIFK
jgi:hypothetical protein